MLIHLALAAGALLAPPADSTRSVPVLTISGEEAPRLDGRLDEAVWARAEPATGFVQRSPDPGKPATYATEARVLRGPDAIYVGMRMNDPHPDSIASQLARRDAGGIYSDWAAVLIDSYDDNRTAYRFSVNPAGVEKDVFHFDDTNEDLEWDAVWEVETQIDSLGWTAEFRIPLSQLRYRANSGAERWGINFLRDIARYDERDYWAPILPEQAGFVSQFGALTGLADLPAARRLEVRPYTVARLTRAPNEPGNPFYSENATHASIGGDVQYGLSSSFTLTATLNPDFGQVEADPSQVNLGAFESFFSERRPFFVEGADIFNFGIGLGDDNGERLFYSRRVGRQPRGRVPNDAEFVDYPEVTTILGAAKLTGRTPSGWSVGLLNAVTGEEKASFVTAADTLSGFPADRVTVEPLTNYTVARAIRSFRDGRSALGAITTATLRRLSDTGLEYLPSAAVTGGVDARHRFAGGDWEASGYLLSSYVRGDTVAIQRLQRGPTHRFQRGAFDAEHIAFDPLRTTLGGTAASIGINKIAGGSWRGGFFGNLRSPEFEANDLGFQREADQALAVTYARYERYEPQGIFQNWNVGTNLFGGGTTGGERTVTGINVNGSAQFTNLWRGFGGAEYNLDAVSVSALRGGPAIYDPARYNVYVGGRTDRRSAVSYSLFTNWGAERGTGAGRFYIKPEIEWRPSGQLSLSLEPSFSQNRDTWQYVATRAVGERPLYLFGNLDQRTVAVQTRLSYTFTPELTLQLYAQPFVSAGSFDRFREVVDPRAPAFGDRFRTFAPGEIRLCDGVYEVGFGEGPCGDAGAASTFADPEFNIKQFRSNAVLRWEYRPGSTLFLVWSQGREQFVNDGSFGLTRDFGRLFDSAFAPSTNVLLLKINYWLDL